MKTIVQKFGGTSISSKERIDKAASKIIKKIDEDYKVVVVVSAIGRIGDPYATDSLLNLVNTNYVKPREIDLLASCGEIIAAVVLSNALEQRGYKTVVYNGLQAGIITDDNFGNAEVLTVCPENIINSLEENKIVIVTGFQGATLNGDITTLGRGGSDTSALILSEALKCEKVEIYTDVDGIMTADPKIVPEAKVIKTMCYSEVYQLAEEGAKVIHPKAVEVAERGNIKIIVKNTLNDCCGTTITQFDGSKSKQDNIITSITFLKDIAQVNIFVNDNENIEELLLEISNRGISIDLINLFTDKKVFTINKSDINIVKDLLKLGGYNYTIVSNCCKISVIGHRMRGTPGVMARIVRTLSKEGISILQSSDSYTTIWFLIYEKEFDRAIIALHKEFNLSSV